MVPRRTVRANKNSEHANGSLPSIGGSATDSQLASGRNCIDAEAFEEGGRPVIRRPKGTGSISKRGSGYIARLVVGKQNGRPIVRSKTTRTRKEAREALDLWLKAKPASVIAERVTFAEFAIQWLTHQRNSNQSTRELRFYALNHALPFIGHLPLARIERAHIRHVMQTLASKDIGHSMRTAVFRTLKTLFNHAIEDDVLSLSPVRNGDRPQRPRHDDTLGEEPLTEEQVQALLKAAKKDHAMYSLYLIAVRLGLREGELLALTCEDVKCSDGAPYLDVRRHLVKSKGTYKIGAFTKIGFPRHVLLPKFIVAALSEVVLLRGSGLLFPGPDGGIYHPKNFYNRRWKKLLAAAGLPHMRFHMLRHTAATHALERGENPLVICQRLGWQSPRMLFERYGHVTARMALGSVETLDAAFGEEAS